MSIPLVVTIIGSALVGFGAIVVGIAALSRIRANPERSGRGMAVGGLVMGVVSLGLTVLFLAVIGDDDEYDNDLGTASYLALREGDCFERLPPVLSGVTRQACRLGHDREVVGIVDHPASPEAAFPGTEALALRARDMCTPLYEDYLSPDAERGALRLQTLRPTRGAWEEGNRRIVCSVERVDGEPLVESVADGGGPFRE